MESYIVQLDFRAAFDRVSHGGDFCTEYLYDRRQKVVVDGAGSEWIPIISGATGKCVGSCSVYPIYQRNVGAG